MNPTTIGAILFTGFGFGLFIAAPFGPMSLLCVNRTLHQGFRHGLASGLGIAMADVTYAFITVFGFRIVNEFTAEYAFLLQLMGSVLLVYLGVRAWLSKVQPERSDNIRTGVTFSFGSAYLLTLANPATILTFMALTASIGTTAGGSFFLPVGIMLGSTSWWLLLTASIYYISRKLPESFIRSINMISSVILILFGLYGIITTPL